MNTAHALPLTGQSLKDSTDALRKTVRLIAIDKSPQRQLPAHTESARLCERGGNAITEPIGFALLAVAFHGAIVWAALNGVETPRVVQPFQEIELLRPQPEIEPKPPKPLEPKRQPPPPKLVETPKQHPSIAQRTAPAEVPDPNAMAVTENLQAQHAAGPVASAPPAPLAPKAVEPVTEPIGFAGYLNNPPPVYPRAAQRLNLQGRVLLRVHVLANGQVGSVEIKQSSGTSILDEAAVNAVKFWTFAPAKRGSTPIDGWATVPIDFKIGS